MISNPPPRLHFRPGVAIEHLRADTYRQVDPITGEHICYVISEVIEYAPTIEAQLSRSKKA